MSVPHTVVWLDHQHAQILNPDAPETPAVKLQAHTYQTRQHGSRVRTEHEFFAAVCDALSKAGEILVTGGHTAQADFRHYVGKHRAALAPHIAGWEILDRPTEAQLRVYAQHYFRRHDRMTGDAPLR